MRYQKKILSLIVYFLLCVCVATMIGGCAAQTEPNEIWGKAEAKEVDINSRIPGRVVSLLVKEGDVVKKGQLLAKIDNRDINAQMNQAQANIDAVNAQSNQANTVTALQEQTTQAALQASQAQLEKAQADLALSESDYKRFSKLFSSGTVSRQLFETYKAKYEVAQASYNQAQAAVASTRAGLMQTQVNQSAEASVKSRGIQAQAALQQLQIALDETEIRAPFDGVVTAKYVEEGSMISQGTPLVAVQDSLNNWVNIKVKETELDKYAVNQAVKLQGRNDQLTIEGTIIDISKKPEFATYRATSERGDTDIITFNVKIQTNSEKIRPGMRFKLVTGGH